MDIGFCLPYMKNGLNRELVQEAGMGTDQGPLDLKLRELLLALKKLWICV